jgi:hypothetical protein
MARPARVDGVLTTVKQDSVHEVFARLQHELRAYVEDLGLVFQEYNPLVAMAQMAVNPATPPELRLRCHSEVASYLYPKLKSMEIGVPPGTEAKITIEITSYRELR